MAGKDLHGEIEQIKIKWQKAFEHMQRYYESESFKGFKIVYNASTWYQFKNPALNNRNLRSDGNAKKR